MWGVGLKPLSSNDWFSSEKTTKEKDREIKRVKRLTLLSITIVNI
jgi:hypothetical protein